MRATVALLLLAALLRTHVLAQPARFHPDEAHYMSFARSAAVNGAWLLPGPLDKPPLTIYANALALVFFAVAPDTNGVLQLDVHYGEFAGRLSATWASLLSVALGVVIARRLWRDARAAWLTGGLLALSPMLLAFSPTAFMDAPMLLLALLAWALHLHRHPRLAGLAWGLAFAAKPQALFFLPLIFIGPHGPTLQSGGRLIWRFIAGAALPLLALFIWDAARPETSLFALGLTNNAPQIAPAWLDQMARWFSFGGWLMGDALLSAAWLLLALLGVGRRPVPGLWLLAWALALTLLLPLGDRVYDRYLLPLLPALALLAGMGGTCLLRHLRAGGLLLTLLLAWGVVPAWQAANLAVPIGGDRGENAQIDELADALNALPLASVIYDRWLGWSLDYYMGQWSNKRRVHYPTPEALAAGALVLPEQGTRYLVAPQREDYAPYLEALRTAGFTITLEQQIGDFLIFALIPPGAASSASS